MIYLGRRVSMTVDEVLEMYKIATPRIFQTDRSVHVIRFYPSFQLSKFQIFENPNFQFYASFFQIQRRILIDSLKNV